MHGILLLDKPKYLSSNAALQRVKRCYAASKAGHGGSLDPLAEGMLPICLGEATKFCQYFLQADKSYWVQAKLGERTQTGDQEGEVISKRAVPVLSAKHWEDILSHFRGNLFQIPPMYSALKHQGKRLYQLAREGKVISRPARSIQIVEFRFLTGEGDQATFVVRCSKGTYIRSLIEDVGEYIGCGAVVSGLRRLSVGGLNEDQLVSLEALETYHAQGAFDSLRECVLPIDSGLTHFPVIVLSSEKIANLRKGQAVDVGESVLGLFRAYDGRQQFVGLVEQLNQNVLVPRRMLFEAVANFLA